MNLLESTIKKITPQDSTVREQAKESSVSFASFLSSLI